MKRIALIVACMLLLLRTMGDTQGPASDDLDLTRTLIRKLGERAAAVDSIEGYRVQRTWRSPAYVEQFREDWLAQGWQVPAEVLGAAHGLGAAHFRVADSYRRLDLVVAALVLGSIPGAGLHWPSVPPLNTSDPSDDDRPCPRSFRIADATTETTYDPEAQICTIRKEGTECPVTSQMGAGALFGGGATIGDRLEVFLRLMEEPEDRHVGIEVTPAVTADGRPAQLIHVSSASAEMVHHIFCWVCPELGYAMTAKVEANLAPGGERGRLMAWQGRDYIEAGPGVFLPTSSYKSMHMITGEGNQHYETETWEMFGLRANQPFVPLDHVTWLVPVGTTVRLPELTEGFEGLRDANIEWREAFAAFPEPLPAPAENLSEVFMRMGQLGMEMYGRDG